MFFSHYYTVSLNVREIETKFVDPPSALCYEKINVCFLWPTFYPLPQSFIEISLVGFAQSCLLPDKQTGRQTTCTENITSLAEVITVT